METGVSSLLGSPLSELARAGASASASDTVAQSQQEDEVTDHNKA